MLQLTTACVSSVDETAGNTGNLLFSGQILPERNAGLNGAPALKLEPGAACTAAVFDGRGDAGRRAAYLAASAFRSAGSAPRGRAELESLLASIHAELKNANAQGEDTPSGASVIAAAVDGDRLALACLGSCRAYLMRGTALYLLTRSGADAACEARVAPGEGPVLGLDDAAPYTLEGALQAGDRLLLCSGWLSAALEPKTMLRAVSEAKQPGDALLALVRQAAARRGDLSAVLLFAEEAAG